jgi:hypothetical protein
VAILCSKLPTFEPSSYDAETHEIDWVLNSGEWDRDGERINPAGLRMADHVNVVDHHMIGQPSVTRIYGVVVPGSYKTHYKAGVARLRFDTNNPDAVMVEGMVRDGIIRNGSIRFDPFEWTEGKKKFSRKRGEGLPWGSMPGRVWTKSEGLEFSMVGVPSNAGAVSRIMKAYGIDSDRLNLDEDDRPDELVISSIEGPDTLDEIAKRVAERLGIKFERVVSLEELMGEE